MHIAICFNQAPPLLLKGELLDRISEEGAEKEACAVRDALHQLGHDASLVPLGADLLAFVKELRTSSTEVVFNLCEGFWGDSRKEMHVAALLDLLGVAHTGAAPFCLGLTQDKVLTKDILRTHGLPTPGYVLVRQGGLFSPGTRDLAYPLIVKPRFEDASLGITGDSIVDDEQSLPRRIAYVHDTYHQDALVEEFIGGRELNAAVVGNAPMVALPLSEIVFKAGLTNAIVSYEGKWLENSPEYSQTQPVCPALLAAGETLLVQDAALHACKLLDCRDYARVDIRLRAGVPYILEINANPDLSPDAGLARSAAAAGISYPKLIERLLSLALKRRVFARAAP
ncbi:MAG: ATP-grasp domain-containing protein [Deltaproteobacteria bacterium]|nr:ATP-grasp domain-containing protein [Candidatus Anaeroferrophillus wilburensis]MBN2887750.1 ATP-grasp domain-containing protein [Deltaproteobacteria bacterium]